MPRLPVKFQRSRWIVTLLALVLVMPIGFALGEGGRSLLFDSIVLNGALLSGIFLTVLPPLHWPVRILLGLGAIAIYLAAYFSGLQAFSQAFNSCVENEAAIRSKLESYRESTGQFPDRLDQLAPPIPGTRLLNPGLLHYARTATGYTLSYSDWLVEHRATESEAFSARK